MKNNYPKRVGFILILCLNCLFMIAQENSMRYPQISSRSILQQTVGVSEIKVDYGRPKLTSANGTDRTGAIWGQTVKYGYQPTSSFGYGNPRPWRAGANVNTTITFSHDCRIEGRKVRAGKYGLFMLVHENNTATIILSSDNNAWGSYFYQEKNDVLRVDVSTKTAPLSNILTYQFINVDEEKATLVLDWEYKRIPIQISFETPKIMVSYLQENILTAFHQSDWQALNKAANYCLEQQLNLEEALNWASHSNKLNKNFGALAIKSSILRSLNKTEEATAALEEAMSLNNSIVTDFYQHGDQLLKANNLQTAKYVFETQYKKWPQHWRSPFGLARTYDALGDTKNANKYLNQSLALAQSEGLKNFIRGHIQNN